MTGIVKADRYTTVSQESTDLYAVLGVARDAEAKAIHAAYRELAKRWHPDVRGGNANYFMKIKNAWEILTDPERRRIYDEYGLSADNSDLIDLAKQEVKNCFDQTLGDCDVDTLNRVNIIQIVIDKLNQARDNNKRILKTLKHDLKVLENMEAVFIKRLKHRRGASQNIFLEVVKTKKAQLCKEMEPIELNLKRLAIGISICDSYCYETDIHNVSQYDLTRMIADLQGGLPPKGSY